MVAGSSNGLGKGSTFRSMIAGLGVNGVSLDRRFMLPGRTRYDLKLASKALAVFAAAVLLYFAAGGSLLHHHTGGNETPCHICQSLHVPVLAAAALDLVSAPELIARFSTLSQHISSSNFFSLHRASRAPPTA